MDTIKGLGIIQNYSLVLQLLLFSILSSSHTMPTVREQDDVDRVVCCKHGKPCQLSLQQVPKSARGQEVPRSPDVGRCGGGRRKRQKCQQADNNSSITDLRGGSVSSSSTNYENIPPGGLPNEGDNFFVF
ncbi:unnamed protein product [Meloidogyne enterolobii]|uniref:Uncharacterized protein n=1 Tax=Meloidogyne enterolobii TaxID=390850 RepID=A0ACB0YDC7_MELEN